MYFKYTLNELVKNYRFFCETDLHHNFYYINDKDMSLGNLDSCHHTLSNNCLKNKKSLANVNVLQALLECTR